MKEEPASAVHLRSTRSKRTENQPLMRSNTAWGSTLGRPRMKAAELEQMMRQYRADVMQRLQKRAMLGQRNQP